MRPSSDEYFLEMAKLVSSRSTCARRSVGCVMVNDRNHIIATGYNGVASGLPHCTETPCEGADCLSGTGLDQCEAIHAEQNAIIQCRNTYEIHTVYCTTAPCVTCVKMLMNTTAQRIVFIEDYPHKKSKELWESVGRRWEHGAKRTCDNGH